jgi:histidinol-phosphate/aromatic aminotransferase/cobyric acid decarboxylase-like protein
LLAEKFSPLKDEAGSRRLRQVLEFSPSQNTVIAVIKHGIYVRTANDKIGLQGEYIRVASRNKEENKIMVNAFRNLLN